MVCLRYIYIFKKKPFFALKNKNLFLKVISTDTLKDV